MAHYPYPTLETSALVLMGNSYRDAFQKVAENKSQRLSAREIASVAYVAQHHSYTLGKPSECSYQMLRQTAWGKNHDDTAMSDEYVFTAYAEEILVPPGYDAAALHEIKHASLRHDAIQGTMNVTYWRTFLERLGNVNNAVAYGIGYVFDKLKKNSGSTVVKKTAEAAQCILAAPFCATGLLIEAGHNKLMREEEKICDRFIVRTLSNYDPEEWGVWLDRDEKILRDKPPVDTPPKNYTEHMSEKLGIRALFTAFKSNMFDEHPFNARRVICMQNAQARPTL